MGAPRNRELVEAMLADGIGSGDLDAAMAAYAPEVRYHAPLMDRVPPGTDPRAVMRQGVELTRAAFPDLDLELVAVVAEDDLVAVLYRWTGTHLGSLAGLPATRREVTATGAIVCRCEDGRIAEQWDVDDRLDVMEQLGAVPGPPSGGAGDRP